MSTGEQRIFEPTEENLAKALEVAERSSHVVSYCTDNFSGDELAGMLRDGGDRPPWYCWTGTKADPLCVAFTGNGPTSEHNAAFFSCARELVIGLVAEVRRLRSEQAEMREDARDRALERDMGA